MMFVHYLCPRSTYLFFRTYFHPVYTFLIFSSHNSLQCRFHDTSTKIFVIVEVKRYFFFFSNQRQHRIDVIPERSENGTDKQHLKYKPAKVHVFNMFL